MKRVLALVVAVAMVGGAYVVRSRIIDAPDGPEHRGDTPASGSVTTMACAPELMSVCAAAASKDLRVLPEPVDLDDAASAARKIDAWLTYGPAPGILNAETVNRQQIFEEGTVVGSGRLALVAPEDRAGALTKYCGVSRIAWRCLVRSARTSWTTIAPDNPQLQGSVKLGVGDPSSALGTIAVGPSALATAAGQDPGIDEIDTKAVARVVASVEQKAVDEELTDLTIQGPAAYSAVVAPEGAARRAAASTRGQGLGLVVLYPEPVATTVVVLAPPNGREVPQTILDSFDRPRVRSALIEAGWTASGRGTTRGLPAPDVLYALREELSP